MQMVEGKLTLLLVSFARLKGEHVNAVKLEYEHLNNLRFSNISTKETVPIDVLMEQNICGISKVLKS